MIESEPIMSMHINKMDQAWRDYQEYLVSIGHQAEAPDFAFSRNSRREIWARDQGICQDCGRDSRDGWRLDAAHYDHSRSNPDYDEPYNGRLLCLDCHIEDSDNPIHKMLIYKRIIAHGRKRMY
jgi:hypothetical protein